MTGSYHEFHPSPRLASYIECYWSFRTSERVKEHVVFPDGCIDLVFSNNSTSASNDLVGLMTRPGKFSINPNARFFGVRFHPGMAYGFLMASGSEFRNSIMPLNEIWGGRATHIMEQILETRSDQDRVAILESTLVTNPPISRIQRAIQFMAQRKGQISIDALCSDVGLSIRHFRRQFIEVAGVSPKHLARIIRFRHSASLVETNVSSDLAQMAADSGYYDQSHMIRDFREFAHRTPADLRHKEL